MTTPTDPVPLPEPVPEPVQPSPEPSPPVPPPPTHADLPPGTAGGVGVSRLILGGCHVERC